MNTSSNKYDFIDSLIFNEGWKILSLEVDPSKGLLWIYLNNDKVIKSPISVSKILSNATPEQLSKYQVNKSKTGIYWTELDEDLSLRGFLKKYFMQKVKNKQLIISRS